MARSFRMIARARAWRDRFFNSAPYFSIGTMAIDSCRIKLEKDKKLGWVLKMEGDCRKEMRLLDELNPGKKRYLRRRILKE